MAVQLNRAINVEDFADPTVRDVVREVFAYDVERHPGFPQGREHRKHWEVAMAVLALREGGALRPDAEILGIAAGDEATSFWLTNHVRRVWATDRYADAGIWDVNAPTSMLSDPGSHWPGPWNPRRLVVQHADALALPYEDESFDGIFSSGSIEHFGGLEQVAQAMDEAFRVLRPGGICSISTEFLLRGDPLALAEQMIMFTPELIEAVVVGDRGWSLMTPPDWSVSEATRATEVLAAEVVAELNEHASRHDGEQRLHEIALSSYPHAVMRVGDHVFTSVHVALRKPERVAPAALVSRPVEAGVPAQAAEPFGEIERLAAQLPDPVVAVDVGCRWGFAEKWTALAPNVRLIGFDQDSDECARLREQYGDSIDATLAPVTLGAVAERRSFRRFAFAGANSLHAHDEAAIAHFDIAREGDALDEVVEVDVETLDQWCAGHDVERIDAVKLDVQGHELDVLAGALARLRQVRAVEIEVSLNPITAGTPLFGEVDAFMREQGFYLWRLSDLAYYPVKGGEGAAAAFETAEHYPYPTIRWVAPPGCVSWGNAYYVRPAMFQLGGDEAWAVALRDAVIANALCFHDLAIVALGRALDAHPPADVAADVRAALAAVVRAPAAPAAGPEPVAEAAAGPPEPLESEPVAAEPPPRRRSARRQPGGRAAAGAREAPVPPGRLALGAQPPARPVARRRHRPAAREHRCRPRGAAGRVPGRGRSADREHRGRDRRHAAARERCAARSACGSARGSRPRQRDARRVGGRARPHARRSAGG